MPSSPQPNLSFMKPITPSLIKHSKTLHHLAQIHGQITLQNLTLTNPFLLPTLLQCFTTLLNLNASKIQSTENHLYYAKSVFNEIPKPATFSYNNLIRVHTQLSAESDAVNIFIEMRRNGVLPDSHTYPFLISASSKTGNFRLVQSLHSQSLKFGFLVDFFVLNNLIHAYCAGSGNGVIDAWKVFDESSDRDVVSYNVMINGFVKSGDMVNARKVFDEMPVREAATWGTMMAGYAGTEQCEEAIRLFDKMLLLCEGEGEVGGVRPDNVGLVAVLTVCSKLGDAEKGSMVHEYIVRNGVKVEVYLGTALVDLYAKCGDIETSRKVFEACSEKNLFTWNAMLVGLAMHGDCQMSLDYFSRLIESGIRPDGVSFLAVLVACSHSGLVKEARRLFNDMERVYNVPRELKHYGCMADILARAGLIEEATEMVEGMDEEGDLFVWGGLLGGCRTHQNVAVAERAAKNVMRLNPEDSGVYSILANVYANSERWDELEGVRKLMRAKRVKKNAGCSVVQLSGFK